MFLRAFFFLTIISFVCILASDEDLQWRTKGGTKGGGNKPRPSRGQIPILEDEIEPDDIIPARPPRPPGHGGQPSNGKSPWNGGPPGQGGPTGNEGSPWNGGHGGFPGNGGPPGQGGPSGPGAFPGNGGPPGNGGSPGPGAFPGNGGPPPAAAAPPNNILGGVGGLINQLVNAMINIMQQVLTTLSGILCELLNSVADLLVNVANTLGVSGQRATFAVNLFKQFYSKDSVMDNMGQIAKRLANVLEAYLQKRENVGYIGIDSNSVRQLFQKIF